METVDGAVGGSQQDADDRGSGRGSLREQRAVAVFHDEDVGIGSRQPPSASAGGASAVAANDSSARTAERSSSVAGADNEDGTT